jgi:hypothetical protein
MSRGCPSAWNAGLRPLSRAGSRRLLPCSNEESASRLAVASGSVRTDWRLARDLGLRLRPRSLVGWRTCSRRPLRKRLSALSGLLCVFVKLGNLLWGPLRLQDGLDDCPVAGPQSGGLIHNPGASSVLSGADGPADRAGAGLVGHWRDALGPLVLGSRGSRVPAGGRDSRQCVLSASRATAASALRSG